MNRERAVEFMAALGEELVRERDNGWLVFHCPLPWNHKGGVDRNPSFGVRVVGREHLHCWSCGFSGDADDLLLEIAYRLKRHPEFKRRFDLAVATGHKEAAEKESPVVVDGGDLDEILGAGPTALHPFPENLLDRMPRIVDCGRGHPGVEYVVARRTPEVVADAMDMRWDKGRRRVVFPVRDFDGDLAGLHGRSVDDAEPRYLMYPHDKVTNPTVWLGEHWVDLDRPVFVVEGPFELARAVQVYRNSVSPLFTSINKQKVLRMAGAVRVVTAFNDDAAGEHARSQIDRHMSHVPGEHLIIRGKDLSDRKPRKLHRLLSDVLDVDPLVR